MSLPIKRIERIQNNWLWKHYCLCQSQLKSKNDGKDNEMWLFHGTRTTPPKSVYGSEKGFDFRFSRPGTCMWGNGSYFAENASYSNTYAFEFKTKTTSNKQVFLARVLIGDSIHLHSDKSRDLRMPPLKHCDKSTRYDSVKGTTSGSVVYVVYEHDKAYPAYLITYC